MKRSQASRSMRSLIAKARRCTECAQHLDHEPRPVFTAGPNARIVIIGQAPGRRVHESGVAWNDASGRLLLEWLGVTESEFYDTEKFSLLPMGFCFPGSGKSGDLPPRPECAPLWHESFLSAMPCTKLTILIGQYSQKYYLGQKAGKTLTENVRRFSEFLPRFFPLPHPSPRNRPWLARNPWFVSDLLPALRKRVHMALR